MASWRWIFAATVGCAPATSSFAGDTWLAQAQAGIAASSYAPTPDGVGFRASNPAQDLQVTFGAAGLAVRSPSGGEVAVSLRAWGRTGSLSSAEPVAPEQGPCQSDGAVDALGGCRHRVQYSRPGVTEWWENRPEGLEHGFTVTSPPGGDGPLVFELAINGAMTEGTREETLLRRGDGDLLRYGALLAWDGTGRLLPAWMEPASGGLRLVVDDAGAVGAITVDPLLNLAWTAESDQTGANFGKSVASAGDVNGDGYDDVVVGAWLYDNGQADEGRAYLYLGSAAGLDTVAAWSAESDQLTAAFGSSVAAAGDVNGDGYGDVVVGAWLYDNGENDEGRAYLYLGSAAGLDTVAAWTAEPDQVTSEFGVSVASAGDVNGDGYGDVVVGAYGYSNGESLEGRAYLYLGSAAGLETTESWTAESNQIGAYLGFSVASAGDVNGDGYGDVVVGAPLYNGGQVYEGRATLYLGSAVGLETTEAWSAESDQTDAYFGLAVASAGDVNGDGYGDVVVGATQYDNGQFDEGRVFLYLGSAVGLETTAAWTAEGDQISAQFGIAVSSAGDVNADGYDDVVVGATNFDYGQNDEGRAYLFLGSAAGLQNAAAWTAESDQVNAYFGISVASAGDVNGDGYDDVVAGAHFYDHGQLNEGQVFLYLGGCDTDDDGICDNADLCPLDPLDDSDGDGSCDSADLCPGFDDTRDADLDLVPDDCDLCLGSDDALDADADRVADGCDLCPGFDDDNDSDGDSVPDGCDACPGYDDALDADADDVPDLCDVCAGGDDALDTDGDDVADHCDVCAGGDDALDQDFDTVPDDCDPCPLDTFDDSDDDGSCNSVDVCPGGDDANDADSDAVPDDCEACPGFDDALDSDDDAVPDGCDACPGFDDAPDADADAVPDTCDPCPLDPLDDSDSDGACDGADVCPGFDDARDADADTLPDDCDPCPTDPLDDSDSDGACDGVNICAGFDDLANEDGDAFPDGCDHCRGFDDDADTDADHVPDGCDSCPGSDDLLDANANGLPDGCEASGPAQDPAGCGCNAASPSGGAWLAGVLGLLAATTPRRPHRQLRRTEA